MVKEQQKTIAINLFAGPGAGKSTAAAYIFAKLKMLGVDVELVTEFAKDMLWEDNKTAIANQLYVFGNQCFRMGRCNGKVRVIVTDSPLLLSGLYCKPTEPYYDLLQKVIYEEAQKYDNLNFFLRRTTEYNTNGRFEEEDRAREIDDAILQYLRSANVSLIPIDASIENYDNLIESVLIILGRR